MCQLKTNLPNYKLQIIKLHGSCRSRLLWSSIKCTSLHQLQTNGRFWLLSFSTDFHQVIASLQGPFSIEVVDMVASSVYSWGYITSA
ncbi:hypothetical protein EB796_023029 [Bugula neritina]|uniref:Uncharacterized protein n=1 Tax=Bugula neritina TaxID=10212 RepID=A0A7J7IXH9_BUGNE|nr:hypothetical protein EB796_023029 [Bugula neritina]